ncbi:amino acid ABC transporter permease [Affinibrenneria salicis]|uniref:Amino acid ABC transporter permease n=1 Tax=Affinibrenneria salicis TaxID=2590031 RepID=A0A5J5G3S5_9GAMM|nr:amino acid ABC transporter permease [Affinibrenneria salicis]KAA9000683.1 amino acid ABC transporter permease [Affinibrenneria salicis]
MVTFNLSAITDNYPYMLRGLTVTLELAAIGCLGSLLLGFLVALARLSRHRVLRYPAVVYIDVLRMIPLVMVIFWIFFLLPIVTGKTIPPITSIMAALIFYNASYMAEIIRSGVESVPKGLAEAARSSGMSVFSTWRHILLPLAVSYTLPSIVTRCISVVMGTSLSYIIGVPDFFRTAYNVNSRIFSPYEIYLFVAAVYFVICYGLSQLGALIEKRRNRYLSR